MDFWIEILSLLIFCSLSMSEPTFPKPNKLQRHLHLLLRWVQVFHLFEEPHFCSFSLSPFHYFFQAKQTISGERTAEPTKPTTKSLMAPKVTPQLSRQPMNQCLVSLGLTWILFNRFQCLELLPQQLQLWDTDCPITTCIVSNHANISTWSQQTMIWSFWLCLTIFILCVCTEKCWDCP